jgi:hypothetical protein
MFVAAALAAAAAGASGYLFAADWSPFGLTPAHAIGFASLFLVGLIAANWLYLAKADELARADYVKAAASGMAVAVLLLPVWLILWMARLLPRPEIHAVYWIILASAVAVFAWRRLHHRFDRNGSTTEKIGV